VEPWRADFSKCTALAELLLDGDSDDRDETPRHVDPQMMIKQDTSAASALTPVRF
jgi:hypothetical protein